MTFDQISEPIILLQHAANYEAVRTPTIGKVDKEMEKTTTDNFNFNGIGGLPGYGMSSDMLDLCIDIDEYAKRLLSPTGGFGNQNHQYTRYRLGSGQYGANSDIAKRIREQRMLATLPDTTMNMLPHEETKPFRRPVIGCEKSYKNQNVKPTHDLHHSGRVAIAGRGRFAKKDKAMKLLWQTQNLVRDMQNALNLTKASGKAALPGQQADAGDGISYLVRTRASSAQTEQKQQRLINFMRNDNYIQSILGLTKQDRKRWLHSWTRMAEDEAPTILATANHLFGDLLRSYPGMDVIEVVVFFQTALPHREPILIRVSAGCDPRDEILNCYYCDDAFQIIDFMGPSGAVKLQNSVCDSLLNDFSSFESFRDAFISSQKTIYTSWSEVAYVFQGWNYVPLLRRCPCDSKTHKNESSEHYIDVFDEQTIKNEAFDPHAKSHLEVPFDPFPSEEGARTLVYGSLANKGSLVEKWDPLGEDGSEEEFDPYPEADHGSVSDIKALKCHLLM